MVAVRKFLATKVFENRFIFVDYWSGLHIALFFYIGTQLPNQWMLIILGSIVFEVVENIASGKLEFLKENLKDTLSDFAFNLLGYLAGMRFIGVI
tara:strand:+ start:13164 stop:13448 length:285 start_codon:yes stop_codon:yes gene_type:complete